MAGQPLLILPTPGEPAARRQRPRGASSPRLPSRDRQVERLTPRFEALEQAFIDRRARIESDASGLVPEEVLVLETVGAISDFIVAVRNVGMEWLGELEDVDIPPDDDFFVPDTKTSEPTEKPLSGRLFLVLSDQRALSQLLSLRDQWAAGRPLRHGFAKWADLFSQLHDVRPWGLRDRLLETGILDDWRERAEHGEETVPCDIELWYRQSMQRRRDATDRVIALVQDLGGQIVYQASIESIRYHALLAQLPIGSIEHLLEGADTEPLLVQCEQIQFFRASGQMAAPVPGGEGSVDESITEPVSEVTGEPVVALFDGLPLENHQRIREHLVVDDPDDFGSLYPAGDRRHGTAMASLIVNGDLNSEGSVIRRPLYVRPILRPGARSWVTPRPETAPDDVLIVDLINRAVTRLFEGENGEAPVAPKVCVINLSIGIRDRPFYNSLSPLARILDWLAWRYSVLFLVSAGNHDDPVTIPVARDDVMNLGIEELQAHVVRAVAADARNRRLLSPAEALNVTTIGAIHSDACGDTDASPAIDPYRDGLPSVINGQGMGFRRSIKPEIFMAGGRVTLEATMSQEPPEDATRLEVQSYALPPGQAVATPGPSPGDLSHVCHTRGTSNATALSSRIACQLYDVVEELEGEPGGELISSVPRALWVKALLAHGAAWGPSGDLLTELLKTSENSRQFKEYLTRFLGYGALDSERIVSCTELRVTALGGGSLQADQSHIHSYPLPPSLSGLRCSRRLIMSLAWFTPVNPTHHSWRRAHLWLSPPAEEIGTKRVEADWRAVQRGTLQHEVCEGNRAVAFVDGDVLAIQVSCRRDGGALEEAVPYAIAVTLEVAEEIGVDIYNEIRARVYADRIEIASSPSTP